MRRDAESHYRHQVMQASTSLKEMSGVAGRSSPKMSTGSSCSVVEKRMTQPSGTEVVSCPMMPGKQGYLHFPCYPCW